MITDFGKILTVFFPRLSPKKTISPFWYRCTMLGKTMETGNLNELNEHALEIREELSFHNFTAKFNTVRKCGKMLVCGPWTDQN